MPKRQKASKPQSTVEPRLLTLADVAAYMSVSLAQAYALVRSGELPAVKIGGRGVWRVDKAQLESYVDHLHETTAAWTKEHPLTGKEVSPEEEELE